MINVSGARIRVVFLALERQTAQRPSVIVPLDLDNVPRFHEISQSFPVNFPKRIETS